MTGFQVTFGVTGDVRSPQVPVAATVAGVVLVLGEVQS